MVGLAAGWLGRLLAGCTDKLLAGFKEGAAAAASPCAAFEIHWHSFVLAHSLQIVESFFFCSLPPHSSLTCLSFCSVCGASARRQR